MISDKMKPVIITLLIILGVLIGIRCFQAVNKPKVHVNTATQEMLENWAVYMVDLQKHVRAGINFDDSGLYADVNFNIDKAGRISDVKLANTSGNKAFDNKMIIAIKKSSPCAPLPKKYEGNGVTVNLTLGGEISGSQIIKEW